MAKNSKTTPDVRNFVHKNMVEMHKCVAHRSGKDYNRGQLKKQLRQTGWGEG